MFQNDLNSYINVSNIVQNAEASWRGYCNINLSRNKKSAQLISAQAAERNQLLGLSDIVAAFVLCKVNDEINISGRSLGDVNVQMVLEKFGGGGHITVAGAQIKDVSINEVKARLKQIVQEYIEDTKNNKE